MIQGSLFENEVVGNTETANNADTGLIISKHQKKPLSKQQQTFNKHITRIEKLRLELDRQRKSLDEKLEFYGKYIHPLEKQLAELNKKMIKLVYKFFKTKKLLSAKERHGLGTILSNRLNDFLQFEKGEPDDDMKEIFKAVEGISYEEAVEEDFGNLKDDMASMFEQFGFDVNFDDIHTKITEEEIFKKTIEMEEKLKQHFSEKEKKSARRKKTKKQLEIEEREKQIQEARTKNIGSIYRQLAKVFHPDLEQDEQLKLEKEELMKQLTIAYENNDLHTLLSLELAWIKREESNPDKLADEKLAIYNEVLKEQVQELEEEIAQLFQHPRYQPLQKFALFSPMMKSVNLDYEKQQIEAKKIDISKNIAVLEGNEKQSLAAVKKMIRDFETQHGMDGELLKHYFK